MRLRTGAIGSRGPASLLTGYSRLYVFGDSYSNMGAGYIDGNGPPAVAYLGWLMGLQITSSKAPNSAGKSLVFAVSGAGTGEGAGRTIKDWLLGYGMANQVQDFTRRVRAGDIRFDRQARCSFWLAGSTTAGSLPRPPSPTFAGTSKCSAISVAGTSRSRCCRRRFRSSRLSASG